MKKLLVAGLFLMGFSAIAKADFLYGGNVRDSSISLHFTTSTLSGTGSMVLIDLSSTTVFPHTETGSVNISALAVRMDKAAASTCTVRMGVVTYIDASSGTIKWFYSSDNLLNVSNADVSRFENPNEAIYRLYTVAGSTLVPGATPFLVTNDITSISGTYKSGTSLQTPLGSAAPAVGDIVMDYTKTTAASVTIIVDLQYHTKRR